MLSQNEAYLEKLWGDILSRDTQTIRKAFTPLGKEDRKVILEHLRRMISEEGWHEEQVISARAALDAIEVLLG